MEYISSDTNVWIDFFIINRTSLPFRLPYTFIMSEDAVNDELLSPAGFREDLISKGVVFLMTGNTFEIMGNYIKKPDGEKIEALGIVDFYSERTIPKRNNSLFLGEFNGMEIVGYTSRFSHSYGIKEQDGFINVTKGYGSFENSKNEGIRRNNLYGTYLLGPFLIQNPLFTEYLMKQLGVEMPELAFKDDIMKAYDVRLKEFKTDIEFIG